MMRKIYLITLVISILLTGCVSESDTNNNLILQQKEEISQLKNEIDILESDRHKIQTEIIDKKIENGTAKYMVTINISQSHFTLDISKHIKDSMNDIELQIPVDKEFYDSVEIGTVLDDSFRMGSWLLEGSFGNWKVKIIGKEVK